MGQRKTAPPDHHHVPPSVLPSILPAALSAALGAVGGYLAGRAASTAGSTAVVKLAEGVLGHAALSAAGPVIAASITGASVIIAALAVPVAVARVLSRMDRAEQGKDQHP